MQKCFALSTFLWSATVGTFPFLCTHHRLFDFHSAHHEALKQADSHIKNSPTPLYFPHSQNTRGAHSKGIVFKTKTEWLNIKCKKSIYTLPHGHTQKHSATCLPSPYNSADTGCGVNFLIKLGRINYFWEGLHCPHSAAPMAQGL